MHRGYLLVCMVWIMGGGGRFGQNKLRLPDGVGSTGFNKANMPHGESSPTGELELAQPGRLPPSADPRRN
jgi:hypothetical protein